MTVSITLPDAPVAIRAPDPEVAAGAEVRAVDRPLDPSEVPPLGEPAGGLTAPDATLLGRVGTSLVKKLDALLKSELLKGFDIRVFKFSVGEASGVEVRANAKVFADGDPLVAQDPERAAYSAERKAAGAPIAWALTGGGVYANTGFSTSVAAGPAIVSAGFQAETSIGYSLLAPYAATGASAAESALESAKAAIDLPLTASAAREMVPGSEVVLRGRGRIVASAGIGAGEVLANFGNVVRIGATVYSNGSVSGDGDVSVRIHRIDGDRALVSLALADRVEQDASVGATIGAEIHLENLLPVAQPLPGGELWRRGSELLERRIDSQLERWAKIDLAAAHSESWGAREVQSYVIDLSTERGAQAYQDLLRLDARRADRLLSEGPSSGVRAARLSERSHATAGSFNIHLGPIELLNVVSNARETHGRLLTAAGELTYDRADLGRGWSDVLTDLWSGKRTIKREWVGVNRPGEGSKSYYHLRYVVEGDGLTTRSDVRRFLALADDLGGLDPSLRGLEHNKDFLKSFDKTDRVVDVYITDAGLKMLGAASEDELHRAFGEAYERIDRPWDLPYLRKVDRDQVWRVSPWLKTDDPEHGFVMQLLRGEGIYGGNGSEQEREATNAYRVITGRNLASDRQAYREAIDLVAAIKSIGAANSPAARAHRFAKADQAFGLDLWRDLPMMARIVGPKEILINELSIIDTKNPLRSLVLTREGALEDPGAAIERAAMDPR